MPFEKNNRYPQWADKVKAACGFGLIEKEVIRGGVFDMTIRLLFVHTRETKYYQTRTFSLSSNAVQPWSRKPYGEIGTVVPNLAPGMEPLGVTRFDKLTITWNSVRTEGFQSNDRFGNESGLPVCRHVTRGTRRHTTTRFLRRNYCLSISLSERHLFSLL